MPRQRIALGYRKEGRRRVYMITGLGFEFTGKRRADAVRMLMASHPEFFLLAAPDGAACVAH